MIAPHASKFIEINPETDLITLKYPGSTFGGSSSEDVIVEAEFYTIVADVAHQWKLFGGIVVGVFMLYSLFSFMASACMRCGFERELAKNFKNNE